MSSNAWRIIMLIWSFFMGIGALAGGGMGMLSPTGEWYGGETMIPSLAKLPFSDTLFQNLFLPALGLFVLVGVFNVTAAILILKRKPLGARWAYANGIIIALFTAAEIAVLGSNPLSDAFCVMGLIQFVCGIFYVRSLKETTD